MNKSQRLYVLDTNVLMHDPTALFRFEEHDVYLPMAVLEELDAAKKGYSEVARNVRQVARFLSQMMQDQPDLHQGLTLRLPEGIELKAGTGKLYFQTRAAPENGGGFDDTKHFADNQILRTMRHLRDEWPAHEVVLVSKDINLRLKAAIQGLPAEDYYNDRALDDLSLLYSGLALEGEDFWQRYPEVESWSAQGRTWYRCQRRPGDQWFPNQCLVVGADAGMQAIIKKVDQEYFTFRLVDDHAASRHGVWGISARNREQNFALNLLLDPDVDFVTLMGTAGTGKTLLTLAAGLVQTLDQPLFKEIIMTRATVPVGEDIGFLPGTEEEKMTPWMGALTDNLEVLTQPGDGSDWARAATNDLLTNKVKVRALNFMRGRTFLNRYLIIDEAQNLTSKQMKTLITRAGPGTKIICLGNVEQIDTPYLTETTSGLTFVVDRFKHWQHSAHLTLRRGERSRLADYASEHL